MTWTGIYGKPIQSYKELIGRTPEFKTWVGAVTDEEGEARVYGVIEDESEVTRPLAVVTYFEGDHGMNRDSANVGIGSFVKSNTLTVVFEKDVSDYSQATIKTFVNEISGIIEGIMNLAGQEDYALIDTIVLKSFFQADPGETERLYAAFSIGWEM
jgi:hypothetical protein